jgi:hypothetical protein
VGVRDEIRLFLGSSKAGKKRQDECGEDACRG